VERKWAVTAVRGRKHSIGYIYVVRAEKNGLLEHWAAATLEENAVAAVETELGPGWTVTLTEGRLTKDLQPLVRRTTRFA
jgi:hypothetical protein